MQNSPPCRSPTLLHITARWSLIWKSVQFVLPRGQGMQLTLKVCRVRIPIGVIFHPVTKRQVSPGLIKLDAVADDCGDVAEGTSFCQDHHVGFDKLLHRPNGVSVQMQLGSDLTKRSEVDIVALRETRTVQTWSRTSILDLVVDAARKTAYAGVHNQCSSPTSPQGGTACSLQLPEKISQYFGTLFEISPSAESLSNPLLFHSIPSAARSSGAPSNALTSLGRALKRLPRWSFTFR